MLKISALLVTTFFLFIFFGEQNFDGFRVSMDGVRMTRNFYEVDPGKFYRSAQLTGEELRKVIQDYGIKTVVNLQGARPGFKWYDDEERVTRELNVKLISISMAKEPTPRREYLIQLLDAFRDEARPILVHCRSGSDRTGEATAIYRMEYMGATREQALESLSWDYWHSDILVPSKKYFISEVYKNEKWAREHYSHCMPGLRYADRLYCE